MNYAKLIESALQARKNAYVPYSRFAVGASLLAKNGIIYNGTNIENASYSVSICAERTALFTAVNQGDKEFVAIAIVGDLATFDMPRDYCSPCGVCRQALAEFVDVSTFQVILAKSTEDYKVFTLEDLLPNSFSSANLT